MTRLVDLSHTIEHDMVTYKGLPAPIICDWMSREASRAKYAPGTEFQIGKIEMVANTGTYVDSPFHRYENGKDLSELPLEAVANLPCLVVRVPAGTTGIDEVDLRSVKVKGHAVLFHTGWDRHWRTDRYFEGHPHLTERAAEWLVRAGAALVGIDSFNIDDVSTGARPVHTALLGSDIDLRAHARPRPAPRAGRPVQRRPGEGEGVRHLSGTRLGLDLGGPGPETPLTIPAYC